MRVAPVAFMTPRDQVRQLALRTSALTHGHPTGQCAVAFWAELIAEIWEGHTFTEIDTADGRAAAQELTEEYRLIPEANEVAIAASQALASDRADPLSIEALGDGWTAETALAISLRACCVADNFENGLRIAVTHGGGSDSAGAIAGNLLGLIFSKEIFNHPWHKDVEGIDLLDGLIALVK